jgi:hypothetical protein
MMTLPATDSLAYLRACTHSDPLTYVRCTHAVTAHLGFSTANVLLIFRMTAQVFREVLIRLALSM